MSFCRMPIKQSPFSKQYRLRGICPAAFFMKKLLRIYDSSK